MNIQEYITSGIIESYVLGLASAEERAEFERLCLQYPELVEARNAFEISLEKQAMDNAIDPPAGIKENILYQVNFDNAQHIPFEKKIKSSPGWLRYAVAASVLLLAGSVYFNINLYNKNKELQTDYNKTISRLNELDSSMNILKGDPDVRMASLKGMEAAPQAYATVYWDTVSHDVYLLANNLPAPPSDMQYQLWALLDGKPIDLGMLDYDIRQKKLLVRMKNASRAQAFAITLEKKDRADISTPEGRMYVMGGL